MTLAKSYPRQLFSSLHRSLSSLILAANEASLPSVLPTIIVETRSKYFPKWQVIIPPDQQQG